MNVIILLGGIVIAATLFCAFLWSLYRAFMAKGRQRVLAGFLAASTLMGMACISFDARSFAVVVGSLCTILGIAGIWTEHSWTKLLPFAQTLFGLALIARLPWGGA